MPLSKHYGGKGANVMKSMKARYGEEAGERVFYATENKMKNSDCRTCMGRKVIHNSPDKHPEQSDPLTSGLDAMLQRAEEGKTSGTYGGMRKDMRPAQAPSPKPAQELNEYIERISGMFRGKKK